MFTSATSAVAENKSQVNSATSHPLDLKETGPKLSSFTFQISSTKPPLPPPRHPSKSTLSTVGAAGDPSSNKLCIGGSPSIVGRRLPFFSVYRKTAKKATHSHWVPGWQRLMLQMLRKTEIRYSVLASGLADPAFTWADFVKRTSFMKK